MGLGSSWSLSSELLIEFSDDLIEKVDIWYSVEIHTYITTQSSSLCKSVEMITVANIGILTSRLHRYLASSSLSLFRVRHSGMVSSGILYLALLVLVFRSFVIFMDYYGVFGTKRVRFLLVSSILSKYKVLFMSLVLE